MKHLYSTYTLLEVYLLSCKNGRIKISTESAMLLQKMEAYLKDSMSSDIYTTLNFKHSVLIKTDNAELNYMRIPFRGRNISRDFVLLQENVTGWDLQGRIIHINKDRSYNTAARQYAFSGNIFITM
jgi:hypothetical protein